MLRRLVSLSLSIVVLAGQARSQEPADWKKVEDILITTQDVVVLDGIEKAPTRRPADNPVFGDWLVRHQLSDPSNLNPYTSSDAASSDVTFSNIHETMLHPVLDPPFELEGKLAEGYPEISEDKLRYTFTLRKDANFSDGKPVSADDVHFSMKAILNPKVLAPARRNYFASVQDVIQHDKHRITFVLKEPYFRNDVSLGLMEVIPRHFYDPDGLMDNVTVKELKDGSWETSPNAEVVNRFADQFNQNFGRAAMGSGPYALVNPDEDFVTGQKCVITRNTDYWGLGKTTRGPGYVDKVLFKTINNQDAAFIELTNGNLDYHELKPLEFREKSWSPEFVERFYKAVEYQGSYYYIGWDNKHPIFRDKRIRKAMTLMTDREGLVRNLLFGLGEIIVGPVHRTRPEYNNDIEPLPYNPDAALDLIDEAGWEDTDSDGLLDKEIDGTRIPFKFTILVNSGNQVRKDVALTLQAELADVGIEMNVRELDWSVFLEEVKSQRAEAFVLGWRYSLTYYPDPYQIWHSSQSEDGGSNSISFINEEVDEILETYRKTFDFEKRKQMLRRFQEIVHEEQPYTFLWNPRVTSAYSRRFQNVIWYSAGGDTRDWFVKPEARLYAD